MSLGMADLARRRRRAAPGYDSYAVDRPRFGKVRRPGDQAGAGPFARERVFDAGGADGEDASIRAHASELATDAFLRRDVGDVELF